MSENHRRIESGRFYCREWEGRIMLIHEVAFSQPTKGNDVKKRSTTIIARREWERSPVSRRIEIARRFCSAAVSGETNLPAGRPRRAPDKAFRNRALCAAAIPDSPTNRGLCSSRAVAISRPKLPATSPFLHAVFSPAGQSDSLGCPSRTATVARQWLNAVFTLTQTDVKMSHFSSCCPGYETLTTHRNGIGNQTNL